MATLKDTVVHNRLGVMEDIVLGDYQYNVVTDSGSSNGGLTFGDINYATTVQGDSLALVSNSDMTTSCVNYTVQTSGYQHYYAGTAMDITSGTTTNISSGGNMTISSSGTLTESGTSVTVNSTSGAVNITSSTTMGLTSGGNMSLTSSGTLTESGNTVNITSATTIDLISVGMTTISAGDISLSSENQITESGTYVTIESTLGNITITSNGSTNITSRTNMDLTSSGGNISISATSGTITESGNTVTISSTSGATTIDANTYVSITAPLVVSSYSYGTSEPSGSGTTGQLYFRIVTTT